MDKHESRAYITFWIAVAAVMVTFIVVCHLESRMKIANNILPQMIEATE